MKTMKKVFSLLIAVCMMVVLCIPALAESDPPGTITINNAVNGKTYTIYRVFNLETDNDTSPTAYKYTLNTKWSDLASADGFTKYFTVDATDGHLVKATGFDEDDFATFLNTYQKNNNIVSDDSKIAEDGSVTFNNLPLGYYFVQTNLGGLCSLDTTDPTATIEEKNAKPTVNKEVKEGDDDYGDTNDASIGDTVYFKTTINVVDGKPVNYVLHDKMSTGLTFNAITSVMVNDTPITTTASETGRYYELVSITTDGCTFEVKFYNLKPNDVIVVSYTATLNENAVVGAEDGNSNEAWLNYGNNVNTAPDKTTTYTWEMPIFKYTGTNTPLAGAQFKLYTDKDCKQEIGLIYDKTLGAYRRPVKTGETATVVTSATDGKISIKGLDAGTYYLKETKAPAGYNMLKDPIKVVITSTEDATTKTLTKSMTQDGTQATQINVWNGTGSKLPSTGGMGTTIFYVVGGIMVAGAAILLITKKRMGKDAK